MVSHLLSGLVSGSFQTPALPSFSLGGVSASVVDGTYLVPNPHSRPGSSASDSSRSLSDAKAKAEQLKSEASNAASVRRRPPSALFRIGSHRNPSSPVSAPAGTDHDRARLSFTEGR